MDLALGKVVADILISILKARSGTKDSVPTIPSGNIERHLAYALNWSNRLEMYGLPPSETDSTTIPLTIFTGPRRFRLNHGSSATLLESDLLDNPGSYLLLGEPGAGKTTTFKRITRTLFTEEPRSANDTYDVPFVILCRDLAPHDTLLTAVAKAFGIPYSNRAPQGDLSSHEYWCDQHPLMEVITEFLERCKAVLIVDGLDEAPKAHRYQITRDLSSLALHARAAKILASSRTGDHDRVIDGFNVVEICPLTDDQITTVASYWLDDPTEFLLSLASLPYRDIVDRPLLLVQLLFIFKRKGKLPSQPTEIYKDIVDLLLRQWDDERGIRRESTYATFNTRRKAEFLWEIAYHLTYKVKRKTFSEFDLQTAYLAICDQFDLPRDEMEQVVKELQTHTGLIVAAGYREYEFSHLSLQEYLCAEHLIREPFAHRAFQYLLEYPAPVAVAVSLTNASAWLAALILRNDTPIPVQSVHSFLARLALEKPRFTVFEPFGVAIMKLYRDTSYAHVVLGGDEDPDVIDRTKAMLDALASVAVAEESLRLALHSFTAIGPVTNDEQLLSLSRKDGVMPGRDFVIPAGVCLPLVIHRRVMGASHV